jgi:O-antigen/teichoic acid export membrane protein
MASPISKLFSQTALYGLPSILGRLLNYLLVPLYTAVFAKPADYGVLSDLYAYIAFLVVLLPLGMETAYFRFIQNHDKPDHVFNNSFFPVLFLNILFFLGIYLSNPIIAKWMLYEDHAEFILIVGSIVCLDAVASLPLAKLRAENRARKFVLIQFSAIGTNILLNLIFLLGFFNPERPEEGILFILIANLCSSAVKLFLVSDILRPLKFTFDWPLVKSMLIYALPLVIAGFAGIINETIDRILLKQLLYHPSDPNSLEYATSQVGIYSACYKLAMLVSILLQAYRYAAEPFFFSQLKNLDREAVFSKVMNVFIAIVCIVFLVVSINIGAFKWFIRNEAYYEGLDVVPILLLANVFLGIYYNQSVWYKLSNQTKFGAYIALFGAGITLAINFLFIPAFGYVASAWATLIAYAAQMTLSYYLGQKHYPIPYNTRKFFLYIGAAIFIYSVFSFFRLGMNIRLRDYNLSVFFVGNLLIFGYILLILRNERKLIKFLKR